MLKQFSTSSLSWKTQGLIDLMSKLGGVSCGLQGNSPHLIELFIDPAEADRSMLPMISRRSVLTLDSLAAQKTQAGSSGQDNGALTCFSSFVAGSGSLHTSLQRTRALPFRCVPAIPQAIHLSYVHQLLIRQHFSFCPLAMCLCCRYKANT